jgi:hypothetical protein
MATQKLIAVKEFCLHHKIKTEFIFDLQQYDLVELVTIKRTKYIPENDLAAVERMLRLHVDLAINIEGIHAVSKMIAALERKETELKRLRNLLEFYSATE